MASDTPPVRAFAPATVSNVGCGFDVFGFAVEGPGDLVEARRAERPGVELACVEGDGGRLPRQAASNTAGVAADFLLRTLRERDAAAYDAVGVELRLVKGMPLKSGLGSSAASAVAAVVAVDALLKTGLPREELLRCAVEGERFACGAAHGDNAAPSLYGGFVLVRPGTAPGAALRVTSLPVPAGLSCALLRPHLEVDTGAARRLLPDAVPRADAVAQWGDTAALTAALFLEDLDLLAGALVDRVAEPVRSGQVPAFAEVCQAARDAGALGAGLSGSGPTLFALGRDLETARRAGEAMERTFRAATDLDADLLTSAVGTAGARVLPPRETP